MDNSEITFSINILKKHILEIEKTESIVWDAHKTENLKQVFLLCLERATKIEKQLDYYKTKNNHMNSLLEEILEKYSQVKEVVFQNNYQRILLCIEQLFQITSKQIEELNISNNLIDFDQRITILNGNKIKDHESEFTSVCSELLLEINKSNELDTTMSYEEEKPFYQENTSDLIQNESISIIEDSKGEEIEIIEHETISETQKELIELETSQEEVPVEIEIPIEKEEEKISSNSNLEIKNEEKEPMVKFNEFDYKVNATPLSEKNYFRDTSISPNEEEGAVTKMILEHFSYQDSPTISDDEKEEIKVKSIQSTAAKKYAKILIELEENDELEIYEMLARKLFAQTLTLLQESNIEPLPYSMSQTWVIWDIAKQLYYIKNPLEASNKYTLENPLESEEKQKEIIYRHVGWIIYKEMTSGKLDSLLANIKNSSYAKKIIDYMIDKPNHEGGSLSSYKLADLGKSVILSLKK